MSGLAGQRVVVMGLGRFGGGAGAARFCVSRGADVLVTDMLQPDQLAVGMDLLRDVPVKYRLGGHEESDFTEADLIVVNPAVDRRQNAYLQAAERAGVATTTEIKLLIDHLPNPDRVIGITGTAGKSTTTAMVGHILAEAYGPRHVFVGGNIGGSLLNEIDRIGPDDWVVLELSSFMLEMTGAWSPHIALITNISDNHLDRHGSMAAYVSAKQNIIAHQKSGDVAVLCPTLAEWRMLTPARCVIAHPYYDFPLLIPGTHNEANASAATEVAVAAGVDRGVCATALETFAGLPHRLQLAAEHNGVRFFNDSKSTTAEAALLAFDCFPEGTVHLILGGYDKQADLATVAHEAARHCAAIYTIGQTGPRLADYAEQVSGHCPVHRCETLEKAVEKAVDNAVEDHVVLLSPACASWDQFENYEERGRLFVENVLRFTDRE